MIAATGLGCEHGVDVAPSLARLMGDDLCGRLDRARGFARDVGQERQSEHDLGDGEDRERGDPLGDAPGSGGQPPVPETAQRRKRNASCHAGQLAARDPQRSTGSGKREHKGTSKPGELVTQATAACAERM